jgi:hypothetical protein
MRGGSSAGLDSARYYLEGLGMRQCLSRNGAGWILPRGSQRSQICQRDHKILWVPCDVGSNPLPAGRAVLATKVVIICRHPAATMAI